MKATGIVRRIEGCVIITSQNCCWIKIQTILENIYTRFARMR